jgi:hypothetical protein
MIPLKFDLELIEALFDRIKRPKRQFFTNHRDGWFLSSGWWASLTALHFSAENIPVTADLDGGFRYRRLRNCFTGGFLRIHWLIPTS